MNNHPQNKSHKRPNNFLAPVVIAGITVGFLASAYKFIFSKSGSAQQADSSKQKEKPEYKSED